MFIKELILNGFRNLLGLKIIFDSRSNLIYGTNGSGKTSVLEAIYYIAFGKSFLDSSRIELANFDLKSFEIHSKVENNLGYNTIRVCFDNKSFSSLNEQNSTILDHVKILFPLIFSSGIYVGLVDHRRLLRKTFDRFIYGVDDVYLHYILRYNTALKQKNALLKTKRLRLEDKELDSWNVNFTETGSYLQRKRQNFLDQLNKILKETNNQLLKINYVPSLKLDYNFSESDFFSQISKYKEIEKKIGRCIVGPHRDYYEIFFNNRRINFFSSGEKKKILLTIFFTYICLFFRIKNEYPILLIDDFDAALDQKTYQELISLFPPLQIIATSVNKKGSFYNYIKFTKENE